MTIFAVRRVVREELVPGVGMVLRLGTEAYFNEHVLHHLARDMHAKSAQLLHDLGVAEICFFPDADDGFSNIFGRLRPASFHRLCFLRLPPAGSLRLAFGTQRFRFLATRHRL